MWTERLSRRTPLTLLTTAILIGLYGIYGLVVGPLAVPPQIDADDEQLKRVQLESGRPRENARMARVHLAAEPWAADARYQLRTDEAFVYFQDWFSADSGESVRFEPFAMIWMRRDAGGEESPITIVSDSAYVKFAAKFDTANPNPGRVVEGALQGGVKIRGAEGLWVAGRNFNYSEKDMQIYCDDRVRFAYGPHSGEAKGLEILLNRDETADEIDNLGVTGIDSVLLRRDVSLDLEFNRREGQRGTAAEGGKGEPAHVKIHSAGSFRFVVAAKVATFQEQVRVLHPDPEKPNTYDRLLCDVLTMLFETTGTAENAVAPPGRAADEGAQQVAVEDESPDNPTEGEQGNAGFAAFGDLSTNLAFRRLTASGRTVILVSEGNELHAEAGYLDYDARHRSAILKDGESVTVSQGHSKMRSPEISFIHDADGRLSHLWCRGAGWLKQHDSETGQIAFAAQWKKRLRKYPEKGSSLDIIELDQQALVRQPFQGVGLAAEFIKLWVDSAATTPAPPDKAGGSVVSGFRPARLLAQDNVAIITPELNGEAEQLEVWFEHLAATQSDESAPREHTPTFGGRGFLRETAYRESLFDKHSGKSVGAPVARPRSEQLRRARVAPASGHEIVRSADAHSAFDRAASRSADAAAEGPVEISAELMRVRVLQGAEDEDVTVAEVWTRGNVRVRQEHSESGDSLRVVGEQLHVKNHSDAEQVLHVLGRPASIRERGLHIEGPEIHFDRARNLASVHGAGMLELPVTRTPGGRVLQEPQKLDVWWKEKMRFDGQLAHFFGDVRSVMDDSRMDCQEMKVFLEERLLFSERSREQNPGVDRILCLDGVEFESKEYQGSRLVSINKGRCAEFTLDQQTGETVARGPGRIVSWRRGPANRAALAPSATTRSNRPLDAETSEWEYTRIDFAGNMSGNLDRRFTEFHNQVEIAYGPVERPLATIDPDDLPKEGGSMLCDMLRFIQHRHPETGESHIEVFAYGNAKLEGRTFHARADEITYEESHGFYMLRAEGNRKATIWRQEKIGGKYSRVDAERMEYIPSTGQLKLDRATGLEGIQ